MLVLSRKVGERVLIGQDIAITVVRIVGGSVRIGIEAPHELPVIREELQKSLANEVPDGESSLPNNGQLTCTSDGTSEQ